MRHPVLPVLLLLSLALGACALLVWAPQAPGGEGAGSSRNPTHAEGERERVAAAAVPAVPQSLSGGPPSRAAVATTTSAGVAALASSLRRAKLEVTLFSGRLEPEQGRVLRGASLAQQSVCVELRARGQVWRTHTQSGRACFELSWPRAEPVLDYELCAWLGADPRVRAQRSGWVSGERPRRAALELILRHPLELAFSEPLAKARVELVRLPEAGGLRVVRTWGEGQRVLRDETLPAGRYRAIVAGVRPESDQQLFAAAEFELRDGAPARIELALEPFAQLVVRIEGPGGRPLLGAVDLRSATLGDWTHDWRPVSERGGVLTFADPDEEDQPDPPEPTPLSGRDIAVEPGEALALEVPPGRWRLWAAGNDHDPDLGAVERELRLAPGETRELTLRLPACPPLLVRCDGDLGESDVLLEAPLGTSLRWVDERTLSLHGLPEGAPARLALADEGDEGEGRCGQVFLRGGQGSALLRSGPPARVRLEAPGLEASELALRLDLGCSPLEQELPPPAMLWRNSAELPGAPRAEGARGYVLRGLQLAGFVPDVFLPGAVDEREDGGCGLILIPGAYRVTLGERDLATLHVSAGSELSLPLDLSPGDRALLGAGR